MLVTTRPLSRHSRITAADIKMAEYNVQNLKNGYFLDKKTLIGQLVKKALRMGVAISPTDVHTPHIIWHFFAYIFMTAAEIMISITVLEFSYTQAPKKMKSLIQAVGLLPIALGNLFTAIVNRFIQNPDGTSKLEGADYYWFFTIVIAVTAILFIFVAMLYKEKTYLQDAAEPEEPAA